MYAPSSTYGYGPGNSQQQASFNPNGPPPQQQQHHNPHQQPSGQSQQHMMFNPQQFPGGSASPYGASQPGMAGNGQSTAGVGGGMGMMQNNGGMAQGVGQHVSQYQTPYSAASYGANGPVAANNLPPNFQMNAAGGGMQMMPQQIQHLQNMQRMQPPPASSTPTQPVPRASPFAHSNTPPDAGAKQSQFPPPPTAQNQVPNSGNTTIVTPQTPNFPPGTQNIGGTMATPMSPGSLAKEQERVTLLLEINRELLMEVMALQASQADAKKEEASPKATTEGTEEERLEKAKMKAAISNKEYMECMKRLQANLAYLAAYAGDKSQKQAPTHPAFMTAPPLVPKVTTSPIIEAKTEDADEEKDAPIPVENRDERIETLKSQYKRLQEMFPDVDPKKEGSLPQQQQQPTTAAKPQNQLQQGGGQPGQVQGGMMDPNAQQKMQNDQFRQKMMQQAQAQAQARAQAQHAR